MNKTVKIIAIVLTACVVLSSKPALAVIVTVEVEGVVNMIETRGGMALDDSVDYGTIMTGSCTYDSETPDQKAEYDHIGIYSLISLSMTIGNYTFTHDMTSSKDAYFRVSVQSNFYYDVGSRSPLFYGPCWINGEPYNLEDLDLTPLGIDLMYLDGDNDGTITDALPDVDSFPDLSVFEYRRGFGVGNDEGALGFVIGGEITSITVIPEPGTVFLFGLGGLALLRKRRQ